jgi:hypothetical protein
MNHIVASFGPFLARLQHKCTLGRLFPYAMIPDVRRLPAGEGPQGAACTATLEEETFSQQAADQTLLVRRVVAKLGGSYMHAKDYNAIYGIISAQYPWGHTIWQGLYMEIRKGMGHHWKGGPQSFIGERAMGGYFHCAPHFSKRDALQPYVADCDHLTYPAVFVEVSEDVYIMWCLAIVIRRSKGWWVHASRASVWPENKFFDNLLLGGSTPAEHTRDPSADAA